MSKKENIDKTACKISKLICNTNTDYRGNLFYMIAEKLKRDGQGYTSSLLFDIAQEYGIDKNLK